MGAVDAPPVMIQPGIWEWSADRDRISVDRITLDSSGWAGWSGASQRPSWEEPLQEAPPRRSYFRPWMVAELTFRDRESDASDPDLRVRLHRVDDEPYAWTDYSRPCDYRTANRSTAAVRKALGLAPGRWSLVRREEWTE